MRQVPGPVRLAQLVLYPGQGLAQRLDQVRDFGLALVQLARGGDVGRGQAALGDFQEPAGALVQGVRGQLAEPLGELPVDQRKPLLRGPFPFLGRAGLPGQAGRVRGQPAAGQQVAERAAEHEAQYQPGKQRSRVHISMLAARRDISRLTRGPGQRSGGPRRAAARGRQRP